MPPIEIGSVRPVGPWTSRAGGGATAASVKTGRSDTGVVRSEALDPGPVPVDAERVTLIRKAIDNGTYPIVPTKITDAIIAAGLLLRNAK